MREIKVLKPEFARVSSKGQVVIPQNIRQKSGIKAGSVVAFGEADHLIVIRTLPLTLSKEEEKGLKNLVKAWKDFETGKFEVCTPGELFKRQRKWISKK